MESTRRSNTRLDALRARRGAQLAVANLRILIGFAFLPAGLKKVLGEPFTDPDKLGIFHQFLHAFHDAEPLYRLVGLVQLLGAFLLLTQRYATLGALLLLPVLVAINALCWSSFGVPTIVTVSLMLLGVVSLLVWDHRRWAALFASERRSRSVVLRSAPAQIGWHRWERCGLAIFVAYLAASALHGGVYRPRGAEFDNPAFYVLPAIALFPLITWLLDRSRGKKHNATGA